MKLTDFTFFKNTPLIDFQNTIHFSSNSERDSYFLEGGYFPTLNTSQRFNWIKDKSTVIINVPYRDMMGVNYCTFKSDFDNTRFYAYVINFEYRNDNAVEVYLLIDGIMTYTQGNILETLPNLNIQRQHLTFNEYEKSLFELKNNGDVLKANSKSYFRNDHIVFNDLIVIITASVNLRSDFGTADQPKMKTSNGQRFDKVTSPLNLYACDLSDFNKLMGKLEDYPWIAQNITNMSLVPKIFVEDNLTIMSFTDPHSLAGVDYIYRFIGSTTNKTGINNELDTVNRNMIDTMKLFGIDPIQDRHLLRSEYTTAEVYNYSGGQLFIDMGQLNRDAGLHFMVDVITGYHNEMKLYIDRYRVEKNIIQGSYINDSLVLDHFDDMPMLINSHDLALSKSANQRALAESKLLTGRVSNMMDSSANIKDRFADAASLASNISPTNLFGKFTDEQDYYKQQKAEQADLALETPSISQQTNGNSFNIANNMFGLHFKYSKPSDPEMKNIKKYYKLFGYEVDLQGEQLDAIDSMSICNYVQFSGSWFISNADVSVIEMMKAQFENGVRLWHNNNTANPMRQDGINNEMVK